MGSLQGIPQNRQNLIFSTTANANSLLKTVVVDIFSSFAQMLREFLKLLLGRFFIDALRWIP